MRFIKKYKLMKKYFINLARLIPILNNLYKDREKYINEYEKVLTKLDDLNKEREKYKNEYEKVLIKLSDLNIYKEKNINPYNFASFINYEFKFEYKDLDQFKKQLFSNLPNNKDEEYTFLEEKFIKILSSKHFYELNYKEQISIIKIIFAECIKRNIASGYLIAQLIDRILISLFQKDLSLKNAFEIYESMYGLYWCGSSGYFQMAGFDNTARIFTDFLKRKGLTKQKNKIKKKSFEDNLNIAYLVHYGYFQKGNALSLLVREIATSYKRLSNRNFFIYCIQWVNDEFVDSFKNEGVEIRKFPQNQTYDKLGLIEESLFKDDIDVLITDVASPIATYLFNRRIAFNNIWLETNVPFWATDNIDWTLMVGHTWRPYFSIKEKMATPILIQQSFMDKIKVNKEEINFDLDIKQFKEFKILVVFTRLIKITKEYLEIIKTILLETENTKILIAGSGDSRLINTFIGINKELEKRIIFINKNVELDLYLNYAYIFLDTFPFIGGFACDFFTRKGIPVVSLINEDADYQLKMKRIPELLAIDIKKYINLVLKLLNDKEFYKYCSTKTISLNNSLQYSNKMINYLEEGIKNSITKTS